MSLVRIDSRWIISHLQVEAVVAICAESSTPHEVIPVQQTLAEIFVAEPIVRPSVNNASDFDCLDKELSDTTVQMIAHTAATGKTARWTPH
jgi:hypothetical protein